MDIEKIAWQLAGSGKADKIKAMADTEEVKRLTAALDTEAVEKAVRSGDTDALKGMLNQVLGTNEGKRLAQQISDAMK